ncbi:MAG: prepilin-type N-terminal cleavage/methylation domain-containing protein [Phycisphaerae bacterium]|nr:prepilin-type N-terminal cleavage/methylation domain-containing protein [Phycisphaerae bacterium]MBT7657098.1 prepilin-type N-terminal cleavage/methylation domain-containing protein [Phycisphaerae bacterium]
MIRTTRQFKRAFTLVELIVVMVVMTILAGLSAMAYRGVAEDLKMSSATNSVVAALDNARAMAIKKNRYVITVFRPRLDSDGTEQVVDIVIAEWNGDSASANRGDGDIWTYDRFVPIQGMAVRAIKGGVNVAGPGYGTGDDDIWWCSTFLPANAVVPDNEPFGSLVGVLYSPEGRVVVRNAQSGADRIWVDFNRDWTQTISDTESVVWNDPNVVTSPWPSSLPGIGAYFDLEIPEGEPFISMTPILAVFNEKEFRTSVNPNDWNSPNLRDNAYTEYIDQNADRIQFNRYSGVPLE